MSRQVEFLTSSGFVTVVDLTPDLSKRLMQMLAGATGGWLLIQEKPMQALQVNQIVTWTITEGAD